MKWINFTNIDDIPKDELVIVSSDTTIDYIIYCFGNWCYCYTEQKINENILKTYNKYFLPRWLK